MTAESPALICSLRSICYGFQETSLYETVGLVRCRFFIRMIAGDVGLFGVGIGDTGKQVWGGFVGTILIDLGLPIHCLVGNAHTQSNIDCIHRFHRSTMAPSINDVPHGQVQVTSPCKVGINGFGRIGM